MVPLAVFAEGGGDNNNPTPTPPAGGSVVPGSWNWILSYWQNFTLSVVTPGALPPDNSEQYDSSVGNYDGRDKVTIIGNQNEKWFNYYSQCWDVHNLAPNALMVPRATSDELNSFVNAAQNNSETKNILRMGPCTTSSTIQQTVTTGEAITSGSATTSNTGNEAGNLDNTSNSSSSDSDNSNSSDTSNSNT